MDTSRAHEVVRDIMTAMEKIEGTLKKKPTGTELICYMIGYTDGLLKREGLEVKQETEEKEPGSVEDKEGLGLMIECSHCHEKTPRDAIYCVHCNQRVLLKTLKRQLKL